MPNRVRVIREARWEKNEIEHLCFQWCQYLYEDGGSEDGYRFIWRRNEKMLPSRGQARIPSGEILKQLIAQAKREGWGDYTEVKGVEGICCLCHKLTDNGIITWVEGRLLLYCRGCAHPADEAKWDALEEKEQQERERQWAAREHKQGSF